MITIKAKMTMAEIDKAEQEAEKRRQKAIDAFKAGKMKSHEVNGIRKSCDALLEELARKKRKLRG